MSSPRSSLLTGPLAAVMLALLCVPAAWAEDKAQATPEKVGVEEKPGVTLPAGLVFKDEAGNSVELTKLIQRPTILTLVYFKCPSICGPLLNEVAHTIDEVENIAPGKDFDLITVSFDPDETPDMAKTGKTNLLGRMETKVPPEAWRFLTGEEAMIKRLCDSVGFYYKRTEDGADFMHAGTVIFLTKDAKIVRYLSGLEMLPFEMEMAVNDATSGRTRTVMQKIQQLCYKVSPDGKGYVLDVTQIVLWVTLLGAAIFFAFVLLFKRKKRTSTQITPPSQSAADQAVEGGAV